jgi:PilZ domain-containing protein
LGLTRQFVRWRQDLRPRYVRINLSTPPIHLRFYRVPRMAVQTSYPEDKARGAGRRGPSSDRGSGVVSSAPPRNAVDRDSRKPAPPMRPWATTNPSRRIHSRVEALTEVYVYWRSAGHEHLAPVRNLSMGGLFIETDMPTVTGMSAQLHFLVQEGQIRADAVVRHAEPGRGVGLRFTAVCNEDRQRLAELMKRLRRSS